MTPTPSQQTLIRQTLRTFLKFKDTYDEVYDHIFSSLEVLPDDTHFEHALNNIIKNELGGAAGIKKIEAKYRGLAIKQFIREYFAIAAGCLTSVVTLLIITGTIGFYLLTRNLQYSDLKFTAVEIAIWLIPSFTQGTLIIKKRAFGTDNIKVTPEYMADARTWVQSVNVGWMGMAIVLLDTVTKATFSMFRNSVKINLGAYPLTVLFFIAIVHSITYYKLFRNMPMRSISK